MNSTSSNPEELSRQVLEVFRSEGFVHIEKELNEQIEAVERDLNILKENLLDDHPTIDAEKFVRQQVFLMGEWKGLMYTKEMFDEYKNM